MNMVREPGEVEARELALLQQLQVAYPRRGCVCLEPARKWDFGTVVGNGRQGALAFCRTSAEELVLSHEELFLPLFPDHGYLPVKALYDTIQQLVRDGKADEAQAFIRKLKQDKDVPGYNTTDPFVGACSLDLLMQAACDYERYVRSVDFESGEAITAWQDATGLYHRRFFYSRADDVMVLRLNSPSGSKLNLSLGLREIEYIPPTDPKDHDIYQKTIDRCEGTVSETLLTHRMHFQRRWESQPVNGCCTMARVITRGGAVVTGREQLTITDADELLLLVRTIPDRRGEELSFEDEAVAIDRIEADYDALLEAHAEIHGELFNRCSLQLSTPDGQGRSTESLQAESSVGCTSPALVEKAFAGARYGIISSTGNLPPALQGVWTGTWKPCWSGDYTLNGNVQSMVAASLCGNHFECMESLMDYMDALMDDFRQNARELLGFRGPLIPWRSSTHGRTHYLAYKQYQHDFPGIYWFAGAAWFAQLYYDYYLYTGDETFFETRLKPFLLESVAFYEDYLTLEQDGVYVLSPASSPENETADNIWMAPNPTMTIAAIKQILRTVLRLSDKLGVDDAQVATWQGMRAKMPAYQIGANGALKEWCWPGIENEEAHRHASHLYPLYDGVAPEIAASADLQEACRVAIDQRLVFRRPEHGGFMAFGLTQLGMASAHLGDRALAYECVEYLVNSYWSPVMVSQHNHCDVLNMDISGGLPAVIITMLVQSLLPETPGEPWVIRLLPCLPDAWVQGRLRGVRCRGGFEVDVSWQNGKLESVNITSLLDRTCLIEYGELSIGLQLQQGESCWLSRELKQKGKE
ncbi:MAG: hypothetical protein HN919_10560 [Verrucomicrobia bacterium]|nr:hypothetical protein [Verrucomicrobiota bacterium]MBT7066734.1 hypothetical protein [Verrucomicrobiota bacterium]MBT7701658.1 hypothetical protein [Verrucomicrobiota bacterium]